MSSTACVDSCRSHNEVDELIKLQDLVFLKNRGRKGSVKTRFPALYRPRNWPRLLTLKAGRDIIAGLALREFDWITPDGNRKGRMIGLVCTHPTFQGQGHGSHLIESLEQVEWEHGCDFSLLWTRAPAFYARAGWVASDRGWSFTAQGIAGSSQLSTWDPVAKMGVLERIRKTWCPSRVNRELIDYQTIPASVDRVNCTVLGRTTSECYILWGDGADGQRFAFEVIGPPDYFPSAWQHILTGASNVHVNGSSSDPFSVWLKSEAGVTPTEQRLAMWKRHSIRMQAEELEQLHIPWFDRI